MVRRIILLVNRFKFHLHDTLLRAIIFNGCFKLGALKTKTFSGSLHAVQKYAPQEIKRELKNVKK